MSKFIIFPSFFKILTCVYCPNYTSNNLGKKLLGLEIRICNRLFVQAEPSRERLGLIDWLGLCIVNFKKKKKTFAELYLFLIVYHGFNNECKLIISYVYPSSIVIFICLITSLPKWYKMLLKGRRM